MKWRSLLAVILGLSVANVASFAQRPPAAESPGPTPSSLDGDGFFGDSGLVRFELVDGRLSLNPQIHRKGHESRDHDQTHESISVQSQRGLPSLQYAFVSPRRQLSIVVEDARSIRIESTDAATGRRDVLEQFSDHPVRWTHSTDASSQSTTADTLLHLRQQTPESFDHTWGGLLTQLLYGRSLDEFCRRADAQLHQTLHDVDHVLPSQAAIAACVQRLGSPRQSDRRVAQSQLLTWGSPVLGMIQGMMQEGRLDANQTHQLRRIVTQLRSRHPDTPATWAQRVSMDRGYLVQLARNATPLQRSAINDHLVAIGLNPLPPEDEVLVIAHHGTIHP